MTDSAGRIPLPDSKELRDDAAALLALTARDGREPPATMALLARQPDLLAPFLGWAAALALNGTLSHRDHELLALRTAWNCRSEFEWVEHAEYARAAGLRDDEIALVAEPLHTGSWDERERALLQAADELATNCDLSDPTLAVLEQHYDRPELVEMLFVVGQYTMLSMVANAAGISAAPTHPMFGASRHGRETSM
ncbi:MAG TPA: carboxymuconolactone decarboxylase family protein [Acidimicrobiia bacterium]|nr:carboxymuconolactone decarboxylase family protein [Acidimicrobiia bacterium]